MNYNETNRHQRDSEIHFDDAEHKYTIHGETYKSVTTIVEGYFEQFDADYWAERKAPGLGMSAQEVKDMWERKGEEARNLGTQMHEKIERYYLGLQNSSDETYALFQQFTQKYKLSPYRTEWAIYDEDSKTAGMLDFLHYRDGRFVIFDWKRSNKIISDGQPVKINKYGQHAFSPITQVPDTTYWHYALQVSLYRYILEKNYGITPSAGYLAVFHPDNGQYYVVEVPYMKDSVKAILCK